MKWTKQTPCLVFAAMLALSSCNGNKDKEQVADEGDIEDYASIADLVGDSVEGEKVSKECAVVCYKIDQVTDEVESVNSPEALISIKQSYSDDIAEAGASIKDLDEEERELANRHMQEAKDEYTKACREYEVPASSVISNLKDLLQRIDKVKTKRDLDNFQDCRLGMLMNLDNIHLCVDSKSTRINEVKRLAKSLKSKWEAKKNELSTH